uniref:Uncharacterized protein n=1 Tax=Arundo donax TaxID=35708 RepID=A0A0A8ZKG0_ARUDO
MRCRKRDSFVDPAAASRRRWDTTAGSTSCSSPCCSTSMAPTP